MWGGIRIEVHTGVPHRFDVGSTLYIGSKSYQVSGCSSASSNQLNLTFHGLTTQSQARELVGQWITVPASEAPELPPGE
ncbi:MAG: hypothetical protein IIA98_08455, partial [Proteobacteria bacterium]|nr:hypothetical protein [Pseudomonadota bacterium]